MLSNLLFNTGLYSNINVEIDGIIYLLHKEILQCESEYFTNLFAFNKDIKETTLDVPELDQEIVLKVIKSFYDFEFKVSNRNYCDYLNVAHYFGLKKIQKADLKVYIRHRRLLHAKNGTSYTIEEFIPRLNKILGIKDFIKNIVINKDEITFEFTNDRIKPYKKQVLDLSGIHIEKLYEIVYNKL